MIRKLFIVFAFALITQLIAGCVDCNCGPVQTFYTTTRTLFVNNIDSALPEPMVTNSAVINANNYGFKMQLLSDRVALKNQKVNWVLFKQRTLVVAPKIFLYLKKIF